MKRSKNHVKLGLAFIFAAVLLAYIIYFGSRLLDGLELAKEEDFNTAMETDTEESVYQDDELAEGVDEEDDDLGYDQFFYDADGEAVDDGGAYVDDAVDEDVDLIGEGAGRNDLDGIILKQPQER